MNQSDRKVEKYIGAEVHHFDRARVAVYKRLKAIAAFPVVLAFSATVIVLLIPERYVATATIQIDPRQRSNASIVPGSDEPESNQPTIEAELQALQSEPVIRSASSRSGSTRMKISSRHGLAQYSQDYSAPKARRRRRPRFAAGFKSRVFAIRCWSRFGFHRTIPKNQHASQTLSPMPI